MATTVTARVYKHHHVRFRDRPKPRHPLGRQGPRDVRRHDGFDSVEDSYTKLAEIPQRMMWSKTWTWPRLQNGYMWHIPEYINNSASFNILMPGAQAQAQIGNNRIITQQEEIITHKLRSIADDIYATSNIQPRVSYPRLHMAQPLIPDETGTMKFRYAARISAETRILFHLFPDYIGHGEKLFWERQKINLPQTTTADKDNVHLVPCMPYDIHNV